MHSWLLTANSASFFSDAPMSPRVMKREGLRQTSVLIRALPLDPSIQGSQVGLQNMGS